MLNQHEIDSIETDFRNIKIINIALILSVLFFGIVISVIVPWNDVHSNITIFAAVGFFVALSMIVMSTVIPRIISASTAKATAGRMRAGEIKSFGEKGIKQFAGQFQVANIIRIAMLEGAAFLNLIFYFVDKSLIELVVAGICLLLLGIGFPTSNRVIGWIENHMNQIQDHMRL